MIVPKREHLFLALTTYRVSDDVILGHLVDHRAWTKKAFDDGVMLFTGRQDPPIGGVMCFRAEDLESAQRFVSGDPFVAAGLVEVSITAIIPTPMPWRSAEIEAFLDSGLSD